MTTKSTVCVGALAMFWLPIACSTDRYEDALIVEGCAIRFEIPDGWNSAAQVVDMTGFQTDVAAGIPKEEAWRRNFIRSDLRGFFASTSSWDDLIRQAKPVRWPADTLRPTRAPHLRLEVARAADPTRCRVEFRSEGDVDVGSLSIRGASLGDGAASSTSLCLATTLPDGSSPVLWKEPVLERKLGDAWVQIWWLGTPPMGCERRWVIRRNFDNTFGIVPVDLPRGLLK